MKVLQWVAWGWVEVARQLTGDVLRGQSHRMRQYCASQPGDSASCLLNNWPKL